MPTKPPPWSSKAILFLMKYEDTLQQWEVHLIVCSTLDKTLLRDILIDLYSPRIQVQWIESHTIWCRALLEIIRLLRPAKGLLARGKIISIVTETNEYSVPLYDAGLVWWSFVASRVVQVMKQALRLVRSTLRFGIQSDDNENNAANDESIVNKEWL